MEDGARRILMFHGSSSIHLPAILEGGFDPAPDVRLSELMADPEEGPLHTDSFPGTYATTSIDIARSYAARAGELMGGEPTIYSILVPVDLLIPDEDEILYCMGYPILAAMGWDEGLVGRPGFELRPWTPEAAREVARDLCEAFAAPDPDAAAVMAPAIHDMVSRVVAGWDGDDGLFHPEASSWASPNWVRRLVATPEGRESYRKGMDILATAMIGASPDDYPCGFESCKGRVRSGISVDAEACPILAIGTPTDLASVLDATHRIPGDADVDGEVRDWLDARRLVPVPA